MRYWVPLALAAFLAAAATAAAIGELSLSSDSPVRMTGSVAVSHRDAVAYHHAHHSGTLESLVSEGALYRHERMTSTHDGRRECSEEYPSEEKAPQEIIQASGRQFRFTLAAGGLGRIQFPEGFSFGEGAQQQYALGPNPYLRETQQDFTPTIVPDTYAAAFPQSSFVLVPKASAVVIHPYVLSLQWGSLLLYRDPTQAQPEPFQTDVREEMHPYPPPPIPNPLNATPDPCRLLVLVWYTVEAETATLRMDQEGADRADRFWAGEDVGKAFTSTGEIPYQGYWDRRAPAKDLFGDALNTLLLPSTVWDLPQRSVEARTAVFERAIGSAFVGGRLQDALQQRATVRGSFVIEALEADDETRRMTTSVQGTINEFIVEGLDDGGWTRYATTFALGGGLVGGMGLYYLWPGVKFWATKWALFPLYARLKKEDILENPLRDDILEAVENSPGISASDLGRRLSCGWGTLVYHLTVLERMQLISSAREGRHRRFFVQGRINYSDKDAVALLANPHARNILDAIRDRPGLIQRDLSRTLGLSAGTVAWHVERMAQSGLVVKEEEGRVVRYYPSQKLLDLTKQLAA